MGYKWILSRSTCASFRYLAFSRCKTRQLRCLPSRFIDDSAFCTRSFCISSQVNLGDRRKSASEPQTYLNSLSQSTVVVHLKDLEKHLKFRGYSVLRWGVGILAAAGIGIYLFRDSIRENLSDEVADVAKRSMGDEVVVMKVNELSKSLVHQIINDPETLSISVRFVSELMKDESVVAGAMDLAIKVVNDASTKDAVGALAARTFAELLKSKDTRKLLLDYLQVILLDEHTKNACKGLLDEVSKDEQSKRIMADFFQSVITSDTVKVGAVALGKSVTQEIVDDSMIQAKTGSAIWSGIKYSMVPRWISGS